MNIAVAEDELPALEDLLATLRPFAPPHTLAGFRRGREVLAYAQKENVDLLITDIHMPGMDGLELIRRLRDQAVDFAAIVLSGYSEFEYARAGIRLGIIDYLLKPVPTETLHRAVEAALASLAAARAGRAQARDLQLAQRLAGGPAPAEDDWQQDAWSVILTVCENWDGPGTWQAAGLDREFTRQALAGDRLESSQIVDLDGHRRVILVAADQARLDLVERQAVRVHRAALAAGVLIHTAYDCKAPEEDPSEVVRRLADRLATEMRLEAPTFLRPDKPAPETGDHLALESRQRLGHALGQSGRPGSAPDVLLEMQAALERLRTAGATQPVIVQVLDSLFAMLRDHGKPGAAAGLPARDAIASTVRACRTYRDLLAWSEETVRPVLSRVHGTRTPRDLVSKLVDMIQTAYWEDISLVAFADEHGVNAAYFSRLFKDQTGVTFSEYQTQVRMAKAKELLARPDLRLHDVSTLVGYSDAKYFGQLFRKVVGISPLEYQSSLQPGGRGKAHG